MVTFPPFGYGIYVRNCIVQGCRMYLVIWWRMISHFQKHQTIRLPESCERTVSSSPETYIRCKS